jgi:lysophospholipase L1-like esterase
MSYGPPADDGSAADRGLVFMAYGQSLSEQFEVVQRWLAGGNSTGIASAASCPIVGVPENGYPRVFSFELNDAAGQARVFQVQLEARTALFQDPQPPTQLEWGLYLFAPALAALQRLRAAADAAETKSPAAAVAWKVPAGLRLLQRLQALEPAIGDPPDLHDAKAQVAIQAWKAAVEDPGSIDRLYAASIWAALREHRGGLLKTSYGTLVADRELAAEVFQDPGKRYSVSGQRTRMLDGFGDIYLGLDAGAEYEAQSAGMNQAIGLLGFDAMFEAARDAATRKIDAVVAEAQQLARDFGDARFDTLLDARELMDHVLADLCEDWFGVDDQPPGTPLLQRGGTDWAWQDGQPPLYPGHFTALSRHMFQPHPGEVPRELGPRYGRALRPALRAFVDWHVDRGTLPRGPRSAAPAPLAEAAFAYLGQGRDTDFVARQIVGVMMGFIPTLIGAVLNVLLEWRRDGNFEALRTALRGRQDVAAARAALAPAMRRAARMRPMPQLTWRTVREAHGLKGSDGREVALEVGDIVVLAIVSGTQQSLADGRPDRELMFGGMRTAAAPPTHACPGYEAGIATMLGCLAALLGRREALREGPLALSYAIEGATDCAPPAPTLRALAPLDAVERALRGHALWTDVPQPGSRQGLVLAWGDSWLAYELGASFGWDLRDWLDNFGYRAPKTFCSWTQWGTLRAMAEGRAEFAAALEASITSTSRPRAVLLSGGGNDSTGSTLRALINPKGTAATVLDRQRVAAHVAQLRVHYVQLLSAIGVALKNRQAEALVPVLVHGYDHPLPAGQGLPFKKKWLWRPFVDAGYRLADGRIDLAVAAQAMRELIDALNTMLIGLQQSFAFVRHVDLRGTVAAHHAVDQVAGWNDDLHPQDDMYKLMAAKLDSAID